MFRNRLISEIFLVSNALFLGFQRQFFCENLELEKIVAPLTDAIENGRGHSLVLDFWMVESLLCWLVFRFQLEDS